MSNEKKLWKYDELYTKLTKIRPKNGDIVLLHIKTDDDGNLLYPVDEIQKAVDQVYEILDKMGIKAAVAAFPDKICLDSVKNADDAIRELQNIIDYVREAKELIGGFKKQKSEKPAIIDVNKLMKNMSFKGEEETQV